MTRIITNFNRLVVLSRLTNLTTDCADNTDWAYTERICHAPVVANVSLEPHLLIPGPANCLLVWRAKLYELSSEDRFLGRNQPIQSSDRGFG
jgi:hypothetical protein